VFSKDKPLNIYIGVIDNTTLRVINNKTEQPASVASTKIGLNNIEMRYSFFTRNKVKIANGSNFEVNVPILLNNQVTTAA
jgi:hypothetical protein